jgi:excisionase family DNA binding protein
VDADQPQVIVTLKLEIDGIPVDALPPITDASEYLTAEEAASYIGVHVETLRKWVRLGVFPHIPLPGAGKDYRFTRTSIDEWARALGKPK